jgi:hypothetical protein
MTPKISSRHIKFAAVITGRELKIIVRQIVDETIDAAADRSNGCVGVIARHVAHKHHKHNDGGDPQTD